MTWAIELLPNGIAVDTDINTAVDNIISYAVGWNWILPITDALDIMQWTIQIFFYIALWFVIKLIIFKFIRGSG